MAHPAKTPTAACRQVKAATTTELLRARWCEPALSVVDVRVGDDSGLDAAAHDPHYRFGPTRFSVIPRSAAGNVSVRFVPDQARGASPPSHAPDWCP
jgi:hypothetical protein